MGDLEVRLKFKVRDEDDWTRTEDKALRKKIQDRLAKRKARMGQKQTKRQQEQAAKSTPTTSTAIPQSNAALSNRPSPTSPTLASIKGATSTAITARILTYCLNSTNLFEHHLFSLSEYSLLRAFVTNANLLAISLRDLENDDCLSPWTVNFPYPAMAAHSLVPTETQLRVPHHPFIDLVGVPSWRDRVLKADLPDEEEDELCWSLHSGGFVVWGERGWDENGWEVSQEFLARWPNLVPTEVIATSNLWRAQRGEGPLCTSLEEQRLVEVG